MTTTVALGEIGEIFDGPHATPTRQAVGPYFLNIASLSNGRLDLALSDRVSRDDFARWTRRVTPQEGDLLFSYETRLGEAALMPAGVEACLGRRMALLRPDSSRVDPRFVLYRYLAPDFQELIGRNTIQGATVNRIPLSSMGTWEVTLPPLPEQRAIAEVLGALDDKIAANARLARTAESRAAAELTRLARLSSDIVSVGDLIADGSLVMSDGYRTKRSELGVSGYRIVRVADVRDGLAHLDGPDFVLADYAKAMGQKVGIAGDILLTTKGTVGRVAVLAAADEPVVYSPQLCFFRVISQSVMTRSFLRLWLTSPEFTDQAGHRKNNTDMAPYINLADIRSLRITLPPIADQVAAGHVLDALEAKVHACHRESQAFAATRDALLPELMVGRLHVRDAESVVDAAS